MMVKTFRTLLLFITSIALLFGRPIAPEETAVFAKRIFPNKTIKESRQILHGIYLHQFDESGFILMSADDAFPAVLAYSEKNGGDQLPPAFLEYCEKYSKQIQDTSFSKNTKHPSWNDRTAFAKKLVLNEVPPLIQSTWHQIHNYNECFPYLTALGHPDQHAYAGCVPVACAQIMNYYEHPPRGNGYHSFYSIYIDTLLSAGFDTSYYDWDNMPDSLCTRDGEPTAEQDEIEEVSRLLYHLAVAFEANYYTWATGTFSSRALPVLVSYFDYNPEAEYREKREYPDSIWTDMLKQELDAGRPIYYRGGNHAFICDGYREISDTLEYFHFNWGWGGYYNGWFLISALRPQLTTFFNRGEVGIFDLIPNPNPEMYLSYTGFEYGGPPGWKYGRRRTIYGEAYPELVHSGTISYCSRDTSQWLKTSLIHIPNSPGCTLSFWLNMVGKPKQCHVMLSHESNEDSCFTTVLGSITSSADNWIEYSYDLSAFKNNDVHIGLFFCDDSILVDDFSISISRSNENSLQYQPGSYAIMRNYPNPFNPITTIDYWLSSSCDVNLTIYDICGKKVKTLVDHSQRAGDYSINWNAGSIPAGIYLSVLKINGSFIETQKLLLVK